MGLYRNHGKNFNPIFPDWLIGAFIATLIIAALTYRVLEWLLT